jgi:UPF0148 protein
MPTRKEDEIMAEYLLKGGKMLEKACKTCGCPLFEVKGRTFCVVCADNESLKENRNAEDIKKAAAAPAQAPAAVHVHHEGNVCTCGEDHDEESCNDGGLAEELAFTIHSLCLRIQNEKDPNHVLTLMTAVKEGAGALETLCRL